MASGRQVMEEAVRTERVYVLCVPNRYLAGRSNPSISLAFRGWAEPAPRVSPSDSRAIFLDSIGLFEKRRRPNGESASLYDA